MFSKLFVVLNVCVEKNDLVLCDNFNALTKTAAVLGPNSAALPAERALANDFVGNQKIVHIVEA